MKRSLISAVLLGTMLALPLAACGGGGDEAAPDAAPTEEPAPEATPAE